MEYAYEKLMKEHNLTLEELPLDAKVGIDSIQKIVAAIRLTEKTGKKVRQSNYDKIKANDKWVVREILDYVESKNSHQGPLPNKPDDVIKEIVEPAAPIVTPTPDPAPSGTPPADDKKSTDDEVKAGKIDDELKALFDAGKTKLTLDEVKSNAKTAYDVIFDNYSAEGDNGVETTYYDLTETEKEVFTLTKK